MWHTVTISDSTQEYVGLPCFQRGCGGRDTQAVREKAAELLSVQGSEEMQTQRSRAAFHLLCHPMAERSHRADCDQQMVSLVGTGNGLGYET